MSNIRATPSPNAEKNSVSGQTEKELKVQKFYVTEAKESSIRRSDISQINRNFAQDTPSKQQDIVRASQDPEIDNHMKGFLNKLIVQQRGIQRRNTAPQHILIQPIFYYPIYMNHNAAYEFHAAPNNVPIQDIPEDTSPPPKRASSRYAQGQSKRQKIESSNRNQAAESLLNLSSTHKN